MKIRFVTLDPTGNRTCLVLSAVAQGDKPRVTAALMERCEQVGYLTEDEGGATLSMMGGEFCGNAAMATAAYLYRREGMTGERTLTLRVSGAEGTVPCVIRESGDGYEGTVDMPAILGVTFGEPFDEVRLEGITHFIVPGEPEDRKRAEERLRRMASERTEPALGLLFLDTKKSFMTPLVYVRESDTMVWETGCGSGSTAIGALNALRGVEETVVRQPGGSLRVRARVSGNRVSRVTITGNIIIREEEELEI